MLLLTSYYRNTRCKRMIARAIMSLLLFSALIISSQAWLNSPQSLTNCWHTTTSTATTRHVYRYIVSPSRLYVESAGAQPSESDKLREQAERLRLEAELMEASLTLQKIQALEAKLSNRAWLEKHPDEQPRLQEQLNSLKAKARGEKYTPPPPRKTSTEKPKQDKSSTLNTKGWTAIAPTEKSKVSAFKAHVAKNYTLELQQVLANSTLGPDFNVSLSGFDEENFIAYFPVALEIERRLPNLTVSEKIEAFMTTPKIQAYISAQLQKALIEPLQDVVKLDELQRKFLNSLSRVEKEQLRREIDALESKMSKEDMLEYSDSAFLNITKLSDAELKSRVAVVEKLPLVMQALYKQRVGLKPDDDNLRLVIELDYYESQLQVLDQVTALKLNDKDTINKVRLALESLPETVRSRFAKGIGMEKAGDVDEILDFLTSNKNPKRGRTVQLNVGKSITFYGSNEDLYFVDRSRGLQETYPFVNRMETSYPSEDTVKLFMKDVIDKSVFMVESKPERVTGGYYIRGSNLIIGDESGSKIVEKMQKRLLSSNLKDKVQFFYIPNPSPLTNEDMELGKRSEPLFLITEKNDRLMYNTSSMLTKSIVSLTTLILIVLTAIGTSTATLFYDSNEVVSDVLNNLNIENIAQVVGLTLAIQSAHELGHRLSAWKNNFQIGIPTLVPSIQFGLFGAITPLQSPPPNKKAMFDFAISGPLFGFFTSLVFLVIGLALTTGTSISDATSLPVFPVYILQSSALGGGLVELFLGKNSLSVLSVDSVQALHPLAIAGFAGLLTNALSLLPLGHTDGGRVAITMFGRRGAYVVSFFSLIFLSIGGLFGLDKSGILLQYALFVMLWQKELETPSLSETDDLDLSRAIFAIVISIVVSLTLLPMV